jgi:hypothetical protein
MPSKNDPRRRYLNGCISLFKLIETGTESEFKKLSIEVEDIDQKEKIKTLSLQD